MEMIKDWQLELTVDQVLRGQGADPAIIRSRRPRLVEQAEWALKEGLPLLQPAVLKKEFKVDKLRHERLLLEGGAALSGALIVQHLAGAEIVVVMICTLGDQLESIISDLMQEDPLSALALEGVGTAAAESLATQVCSRLEEHAQAENLKTSIPLSPGMVGWPVDPGQRQIFALLDGRAIGVRLTESLMMIPRMSLTQVVGFGKEITYQGRTCDFCSLNETCRYQDHYLAVQAQDETTGMS